MSGILNLQAASLVGEPKVVTVGTSGTSYGLACSTPGNPFYGTISSFAFKGVADDIRQINFDPGSGGTFTVSFFATHAQGYFNHIKVSTDGGNTFVNYYTVDALYGAGPPSVWIWSSAQYWDSGDSGLNRQVIFYY